jgi:hypothetical protein
MSSQRLTSFIVRSDRLLEQVESELAQRALEVFSSQAKYAFTMSGFIQVFDLETQLQPQIGHDLMTPLQRQNLFPGVEKLHGVRMQIFRFRFQVNARSS